jgi:signal transduction histidine kinase
MDSGTIPLSDLSPTRTADQRGYGAEMTDAPTPPLLTRLSPRHRVALDWAVVMLLAAFAILGWRELAGMHGPRTVDVLIVVASILPAGLRRRRPRQTLAIVTVAGALAIARSTDPAPALATAYVIYLIPLRFGRRAALRLLAGTVAVTVLGVLVLARPPYSAPDGNPIPTLVASVACIAGAWALGYAVRQRRAYAAAEQRMREREIQDAAKAQIEQARRAQNEERLEIARELHDVVAHAMSVIAVQAGVGNYVAAEQPEEAARALASIEQTSRGALVEMRALLGVLRDAEGLAPAPGLAAIGDLVGRAADAGVRVELNVAGAPPLMPAGMELAAYRVAQEAVTNVIKHSGTDSCRLDIDYQDTSLRLEVLDHGRGAPVSGFGHGLIGMRERAAMYGGHVEAGPLPGGHGFRVVAVFPFTPAEPESR